MKLGSDEIRSINALSVISGVSARDCLIGEKVITYLVNERDVGRAIGKNASNVRKLRERINKQIEILEYSGNVEKFLQKALSSIELKEVIVKEVEGKRAVVVLLDSENKRKFMDMSARFRRIKEIAKRDYNVGEIKVK